MTYLMKTNVPQKQLRGVLSITAAELCVLTTVANNFTAIKAEYIHGFEWGGSKERGATVPFFFFLSMPELCKFF